MQLLYRRFSGSECSFPLVQSEPILPSNQSDKSSQSKDSEEEEDKLDVVGLDDCDNFVKQNNANERQRSPVPKRAFDMNTLLQERTKLIDDSPSPKICLGPPPANPMLPPTMYPFLLQSSIYQQMAAAHSASLNPLLTSAAFMNSLDTETPLTAVNMADSSHKSIIGSRPESAFHSILPKARSPLPLLALSDTQAPSTPEADQENKNKKRQLQQELEESSSKRKKKQICFSDDIQSMENLVSGLTNSSREASHQKSEGKPNMPKKP